MPEISKQESYGRKMCRCHYRQIRALVTGIKCEPEILQTKQMGAEVVGESFR